MKTSVLLCLFFLISTGQEVKANYSYFSDDLSFEEDSDKVDLKYKFEDDSYSPETQQNSGGMYLNNPSNVKSEVVYDPETEEYIFTQKIGDRDYRPPSKMSLEEYKDYQAKDALKKYWSEKSTSEKIESKQGEGFRPTLTVNNKLFEGIFGGNTIDIRPQGSAELIFGVNVSKTENPAIPVKQRQITTFDFDEKIQLNVTGSIGEKMKLNMSYNTEAMFDFENITKLGYTGNEDEIIQLVEAGNVTLPLKGSLITGSQSLFGIKVGLKFGRLNVTSVISQQKGKKSEIEVQGGAQIKEFEVKGDRYEANRHYFLSHFFRDNYERSVANPPLITSGYYITKIEVFVTNRSSNYTDTRNIIAFQDLGEGNMSHVYNPSFVVDLAPGNNTAYNKANSLYDAVFLDDVVRGFVASSPALVAKGLNDSRDYQRLENAYRLNVDQDYTLNPQLGYISLNQELQQDQVLAVAFQYTYNGTTYQVGEFSTDGVAGEKALYMKLLKGVETDVNLPMWDLMMKNVYSLGAYQVKKDGFFLDVWYLDAQKGVNINYIPEPGFNDKSIIQLLGLDKLNVNGIPSPDGVFDFLDNPLITIIPRNGKIIFPVLEPFGRSMRDLIGDSLTANKYVFDSLYTTTQGNAMANFPNKNRFTIKGKYQSSVSSDISLNALNVPEGSVTVTAGGQQLVEGTQYTVNYTMGRVSIIDQGILESGVPIKISLESNSMFAIQQKSMLASRFDYTVSKNLTLGGTIMRLTERPLTQKVNIGDEPIANTIYGVDGTYTTDSELLTTLLDKIPLINTKEKSTTSFSGEFAQLIPGQSKAIGKNGTSYIDDFEGSQSAIDIRSFTTWQLASTPRNQPNLFPEGDLSNNLAYGFNRAKLAWYVVDPSVFYRNQGITPAHIKNDPKMQSNHFMREVYESEVFPQRDLQQAQQFSNIPLFDLAYYPDERGPYNYDVTPSQYSAGIDADGKLKDPKSRWGGIMRRIETNDFDAANIEYIQFWMMDPFAEQGEPGFPDQSTVGDLYFNIGSISEDILRDGQKTFENGLPTTEAGSINITTDTLSVWGRTIPSNVQQVVNAFDNDPQTRPFQDVGLDGLRNEEERSFFKANYLDKISAVYPGSAAYAQAVEDPSADDYNFFRDDDYDAQQLNTLQRYKKYNGLEGNSPTAEQSASQNADGYPTTASTLPNSEDINRDFTLNESERYYQYRVKISAADIDPSNVGNNYITDVIEAPAPTKQGIRNVRWYQFKIPIRDDQKQAIGGISDFRSIRFMRIFMTGFEDPVFLRFARLELIRGEWRRYTGLREEGSGIATDQFPSFNIAAVNIEENSKKTPVNYILPPDILREINFGTTNLQRLNEQSLALDVCGLKDGAFEAAYRNVSHDVRSYKRLKMFAHLEVNPNTDVLKDGDVRAFIRLGSDFENNYYEYEIPLKVTPPGFYNGDSESDQRIVWPNENVFDIEFNDLHFAKTKRNEAVLAGNASISSRFEYQVNGTQNKIYVVGNPNLSTLRTVMLGVRNPAKRNASDGDDGLSKCAEVWFNELRVTDFDNQSGWAAIGRLNTKLADLGTASLSGSMSTPGFGSVEKKVSERQRETIQQFDASFTTDLGRFLPKATNLKIPMYVGYSKGIVKPQFDPLNPDLEFDRILPELSDSLQEAMLDVSKKLTQRRSVNFTNVRKEKSAENKISTPLDISNFSATYAYTETYERDINIEHNTTRLYKGAITYDYSLKPITVAPFKNVGFLKSKYFKLITDANFFIGPKQIAFRTDVNRMYNERVIRNNNPGITANLKPFYNKSFTWARAYDLKYDITRALKFDFTATNEALLLEKDGLVDKRQDKEGFKEWRSDLIDQNIVLNDGLDSLRIGGQNTTYKHQSNVNWTLPISKIPGFDWVNSTARYSSTFDWHRAPFAADTLGHTIQNSNSKQLNGTFNFLALYNKVDYLKNVNQKIRRNQSKPKKKGLEKKVQKIADNKSDSTKTKKKKDDDKVTPLDHVVYALMGLKNGNVSYTQTNGLLLPGYKKETRIIGFDEKFDGPGLPFLFGAQSLIGSDRDKKYAVYAAEQDWLVKRANLSTQHTTTYSENLNMRTSIEPFRDMRIEVSGNMTKSKNTSEFFIWNDDSLRFLSNSFIETGNYSVSYNLFKTAFVKDGEENTSDVFQQFLDNRDEISQRVAAERAAIDPNYVNTGHVSEKDYQNGYGSTSQDVLIPAFLAAYSGQSASKIKLNPLKQIPKANWRVTYSGLSKIEALKPYFTSVTLNHSYTSNMNVSSYTSNTLFIENDRNNDGYVDTTDINFNYIPNYQYGTVTITEQFNPLFNVDMTWANSLQTRIEFKKDRTLSLGLANSQVTEVKGGEFVVGLGYRIPKVEFPVRFGGIKKKLSSALNLRMDVSVRNNKTTIRKAVEGVNQITAGQRIISTKFTADYQISSQLSFRFFYDFIRTRPEVSTSFPTANTKAGISIRFTLTS